MYKLFKSMVYLHIFVLFRIFLSFVGVISVNYRFITFVCGNSYKTSKCLIHSRFVIRETTLIASHCLALYLSLSHTQTHNQSPSPTLVAFSNLFIYFGMYLGFRLLIVAHYLMCSLVHSLLLHIYFHKYKYLTYTHIKDIKVEDGEFQLEKMYHN